MVRAGPLGLNRLGLRITLPVQLLAGYLIPQVLGFLI